MKRFYLLFMLFAALGMASLVSCDGPKTPPGIDYSLSAESITDGEVAVTFENGYFFAGGEAHVFTKLASDYVPTDKYVTKAEIVARGDKNELEALRLANAWMANMTVLDTLDGHYDITIHAYLHERMTGLTLKADRHWDNNAAPPNSPARAKRLYDYKEADNDPYPYIF